MFLEPACIVQHHAELAIFEIAARRELVEIQTGQVGILGLKNSHTATLLALNAFEVAGSL